ncbi:hypothetical protein EVAR_59075_1 [Eumeta japonica]|uniref:Uncharacterized protein n=1 Tax=Eumeta variegata TaxID=151549 RepID=A0A4C1YX82_EUMVA|nr:hypothetical protein EVAR_59075_1 [Eumeta japonica]
MSSCAKSSQTLVRALATQNGQSWCARRSKLEYLERRLRTCRLQVDVVARLRFLRILPEVARLLGPNICTRG